MPSALPTPCSSVMLTALPDGAVLHSSESVTYYGLSDIGVLVWEALLRGGSSLDLLCDDVRRWHPDASDAEVRRDIQELLSDLARWGFVERSGRQRANHESGLTLH